ncbi:P-loop containing nucleoside triphosphate hydrolase protein [Boeremia exigua]|uniref:P-loop containing nucleoside triphosphate hydrolase protein n=1 Tax=Boeremia exigua TaxID=749465 RepID=UPI001E8DD42D|nr:P-loop containing nucleoside triphosphate hydrolase protein [Boeremia exigua]KAH6639293.1 P-loop containing nucleoside triphosphate hydrolase protein [Boeremia exigua]
MASAGASSISVTVRVRPFTIREAAQLTKTDDSTLFLGEGSLAAAPTPRITSKGGIRPVIKVLDERCLIFDPPEDNPVHRAGRSYAPQGKRVKDQTFAFDRVFDDTTSQADIYESTAKPLLDNVLDGYNATVFAYGATGCGKTHTITGSPSDPGIIFLTMQELFEKINERSEEKVTEVTLSYLEIYNETIRDLLVEGGSKTSLMLREDSNQAVSVAGLTSHRPVDVNEVMEMIVRGNDLRTMSPTEANATSSRSHAVLQINVSSKDRNASVNEPHTMATLSIIDLAGSERASATKNRGARLTEGANINKSLLALGSCINALCDMRKHNHIPYRNSKLTRLLKFSLGGNCKTVMIVCVSPSSVHFDETQNTLRYANRAKNIQTKVTKNVFNVNRHVKDYLKKIDEQRALIEELMKKQKDSDSVSLAKVQKQNDKRDGILRDAFIRLRQAYADSETERRERLNVMRTLKLTEKRISLVSAWIAAFDTVSETRENEEMPTQITAMRDSAIGISAELEQSRQHHHRRLERSTWASKLDTALNFGLRQLAELDGTADGPDAANITREYQILKSNAEREVLSVLLEQERGGDAATVQVLVQAHIETVAILSQITQMDEAQAVETARKLLTKIMNACTTATGQVIRPDGGLPTTEFFAPSHKGTPKRRKPVDVMGPSPVKSIPMPSFADAPHLTSSPMKASPRRKKMVAVKKGIQFSPTKKRPTSPSKAKRGVRWRDDNENGTLADFKTPEQAESTLTSSSFDVPPPMFSPYAPEPRSHDGDSSPIPVPPTTSLDIKPRSASSRFAAGFLSKKSDGSPMPIRSAYNSDSDTSPLREIGANIVRPSALNNVELASEAAASANDSGNSSAGEDGWSVDPTEANQIRTAIKRRSSTTKVVPARVQRHRSPSNTSSSPPNENSISASAARRMVKNNHEGEWKPSVLSPRSAPIVKGAARRTTVAASGDDRSAAGTLNRAPIRVVSNSSVRGSLAASAKGVWR